MGDPLSIASGVVALVTFALQSSVVLYSTVRSFQSQDKDVRALKGELNDLTTVLECLLDTVTNHPELEFAALETPLHRCGKACEEYGDIITRCTKHSTGSRPSIRDWITQKYLQGDIDDFRAMLAGYKSTINIALANANIHVVAITPKALEDYKDLISDTSNDLQKHMQAVEAKLQLLLNNNKAKGEVINASELEAILEEKASTQQGLSICAQLSLQIEQFKSTTRESPDLSDRSSAHKLIGSGLDSAKGSIQSLVTRLQIREDDVEKQLAALVSSTHTSENAMNQLTQLQQTKDSLRQCINIVSGASETLMDQRRNVFEDINMADDKEDMPAALSAFAVQAYEKFKKTGNISDIHIAVKAAKLGLTFIPENSSHLTSHLSSLGAFLSSQYERTGEMADLEEAIKVARQAVDSTPDDHADRAAMFSNLGNNLESRYERTGEIADLEEAIKIVKEAIDLTPDDHADRAGWLSNLGVFLSRRYERTGEMADLEEAIKIARQAVDSTPDDHANRATMFNNLGNKLSRQSGHAEQEKQRSATPSGDEAPPASPQSLFGNRHGPGFVLAKTPASKFPSDTLILAPGSVMGGSTAPATTPISHEASHEGDKIQSIISDDDDIDSQASDETTTEEMAGNALIRLFLAEELQFKATCLKALHKLGRNRFVENLRRLLKAFYKDLLAEAQSEAEKAVARLLRSRRGRLRISDQFALYMAQGEEDIQDNSILLKDKHQIEAWLARVADTPGGSKWEVTVHGIDDDSSTFNSEEDVEKDIFPVTSDLRLFLRQSKSFRKLQKEFMLILIPSDLSQVLQSIPRMDIWVSQEQELSLSNKMKTLVEENTQLRWNWWPLSPRKRMLQHNEARMFWRCSCGAEQWQEISDEERLLVETILDYLGLEPKSTYLCALKGESVSFTTWLKSLFRQCSSGSVPLDSSAAQKYTPPGKAATPSLLEHQSPQQSSTASAASVPAQTQQRNSITRQQTSLSTPFPSVQDESWILFGVQGASPILIPSEIQVKSQATDYSVFQDLKRCYQSQRGWLRLWFSIWRLEYCEVVKFDRLALNYMARDHRDLPTHQEYKYEPRRDKGAKNPPISPHSFKTLFYACSSPCTWPVPHQCISISTGCAFLERIPKRRRSFEKDLASPIWGLEAVFELYTAYVLVYHCCIIAGPLTFWGWWLRFHPDDLQNASVPMTIILTCLSLFWSCAGILTSSGQKRD